MIRGPVTPGFRGAVQRGIGRRSSGGPLDVRQIAFMGDSQTELGFTNLIAYNAVGPATHARYFGGSKWDAAKNGTKLEFATGGSRTDQIIAAHHSEVLASAAELVVVAMGVNDCFQLIANSVIIDNIMAEVAALRASGRRVVVCTITPVTTQPEIANGRTPGSISAKIAVVNGLLRSALPAAGIPCCDIESLLTTSGSNDGIANPAYFVDGLHPSALGASRWGRQLAATLAATPSLRFPLDNWTNTNWVTTNSALAGTNGNNPTGWSVSGGGLTGKTFTSTPEGNWWQVTSDGTTCYVDNFSANIGGSVAGKTLESIVEVQVISGSLRSMVLTTSVSQITGNTGNTNACAGGTAADGIIQPSDGIVVLRTPAATLGTASGASPLAWAGMVFQTTAGAVVRFRRLGARETTLL